MSASVIPATPVAICCRGRARRRWSSPTTFSNSRSNSEPVKPPTVQLYAERVIHGEIYKARPDVLAVCHHHAAAIMPFCISGDPVVPVFHLGAAMGAVAPFWDSRDDFGDTNLLVVKPEEGASLARALGSHSMVLMRRHGATVVGPQPARAGFPLDLFLRQCALPERGQAARPFRAADAGRDRDGAVALRAAEHPFAGLGILGDAARQARRDAGGAARRTKVAPKAAPAQEESGGKAGEAKGRKRR